MRRDDLQIHAKSWKIILNPKFRYRAVENA